MTDDGSFYTKGCEVWRHPRKTARADGKTSYSLGFPVCTASEAIGEEGAKAICDALNASQRREAEAAKARGGAA
jgi:hypothetical protein